MRLAARRTRSRSSSRWSSAIRGTSRRCAASSACTARQAGRRTRSPPPATSTANSTQPLASDVATAPKASTQETQWTRCPSCEAFVYHKRLKRNLGVCPECNYHFRLPVRERLAQLLDEGSFNDLSQ